MEPGVDKGLDFGVERTDHRTAIGRLSRDQRRALLKRSDRAGLLHLAGHLGAIAFLSALIAMKLPGWPVLMLPLGILLVFLFCLEHEAVHRTPFRSAWLNDATAFGTGLAYGLPPVWFRHFHLEHHRFTNVPGKDPELARPLPARWGSIFWYISALPFWFSQVKALLTNALGRNRDSFIPAQDRAAVAWEARLFVAIYAALFAGSLTAGSTILLWVWIVPILIGQPFLRLYLLTEHTGCPHVANYFENTRTTTTNGLIRFIAWNMPYHIEHHAFAAVPFHQLPAFHRLVKDDLVSTAKGYPAASRDVMAHLLARTAP